VKFKDYVNELRITGKCQCWDCLRQAGFTPPKGERGNHPSISPHGVFGKDEGGEPVLTHGTRRSKDKDQVGTTPSEGHELRESVRNRSAI
jgi:hypothetical protein